MVNLILTYMKYCRLSPLIFGLDPIYNPGLFCLPIKAILLYSELFSSSLTSAQETVSQQSVDRDCVCQCGRIGPHISEIKHHSHNYLSSYTKRRKPFQNQVLVNVTALI